MAAEYLVMHFQHTHASADLASPGITDEIAPQLPTVASWKRNVERVDILVAGCHPDEN